MDDWGNWHLASQSDAMTIAQPFMAVSGVNRMKSPARDGRKCGGRPQGPFVPDGTLENCGPRIPAMNGWAIFNGARGSRMKLGGDGNQNGATPSTLRSSPTAEDGHSLPRRSNSPRRHTVKTGAKTGAFRS